MESAKTSVQSPKPKWQDRLDRDDYEILEKVITYGNAMNHYRVPFHRIQDMVATGSVQLEDHYYKLPRPSTLEEGHVILKEGLRKAYEVNPLGLVETAAGGKSGRGHIITSLMATIGPNIPRGEVVNLFAISLSNRYALRNMNPEFGIHGDEMRKASRDRIAPSSNAIEYFDPSEGGVIFFLQHYMNQTLKKEVLEYLFSKERNNGVSIESLDATRESGFEPYEDAGGNRGFVRQRRSESHEDHSIEADGVEVDEEDTIENVGSAIDEQERRGKIAKRLDRDLGGNLDPEVDQEEELDPIEEEDRLIEEANEPPPFVPTKPFDSNDLHREDLLYVVEVMRANDLDPNPLLCAVTPELRNLELKRCASEIVQRCENMPEHHDIVEAVSDWDPDKRALYQFVPEFFGYFEKTNLKIEAEDMQKPIALRSVTNMIQSEFSFVDADRSDDDRKAAAIAAAEEVWRKHAPVDGLEAGDRVDHRFLARRTNTQRQASNDPKEFSQQMRKMARAWLGSLFDVKGMEEVSKEFADAVDSWDPMKNYVSEAVCAKIREMAMNNVISNEQTGLGVASSIEADQDSLFAAEKKERKAAKRSKRKAVELDASSLEPPAKPELPQSSPDIVPGM